MSETLAEIFSSRVRATVLAHLLPRPHLGFGLTDLSRLLSLPVSSIQHECYKLSRLGVVQASRVGAARHYWPDPRFPLLAPLTALVLRDLGWEAALRGAAEGVERLDLAAVARATPNSPTTLLVVGGLDLEALDALAARAGVVFAAHGGAEPELAFFPSEAWRRRLAAGDPLACSLAATVQIWMAGNTPPLATGEPGSSLPTG